jgi:hypothetical protein
MDWHVSSTKIGSPRDKGTWDDLDEDGKAKNTLSLKRTGSRADTINVFIIMIKIGGNIAHITCTCHSIT